MIYVDNKFDWADIVYLKTDPEQQPRMMKGLRLSPDGTIIYLLGFGATLSEHYEFEISDQIDVLKQTA